METAIIRTQAEIEGASSAVLVATYNALTGSCIKKFECRAVAERRVAMAILSATDAAGHAGVKRGEIPTPKTREELNGAAKWPAMTVEDLKKPTEPEFKSTEAPDAKNPFQPGSMAHGLWVATHDAVPPEKRPAPAQKVPRVKGEKLNFDKLRATFAGTSRTQEKSTRHAVLMFIQKCPDGITNVAALEKHFKQPVRGYLQKLLEKNHIQLIEEK